MKASTSLSGEQFDHKVAAIFDTETEARNAARALRAGTDLNDSQIFVIRPDDPNPGWELEPESRGIWHTLVRAHLRLGLVGAVAGLVLFSVLYFVGIPFITNSALASVALLVALCAVLGLLLGGLVTLRPDHLPYIQAAGTALTDGKYVLALHASSVQQQDQVKEALSELGIRPVSSL